MSSSLRIAPGTGIVRRTATAVLFVPTGDDRLLHVLDSRGTDADELAERLGDAIVDLDDAPPCCLVAWSDDAGPIVVMVRGDIEVNSDLPTMPSLTGHATSTWVEHRIRRRPERGVVRCGATVDQRTDLAAGTIPAGGVEIEFVANPERTDVPAVPTTSSADRPIPAMGDPLEEITLPEPDLGQLADVGAPSPADESSGEPSGEPSVTPATEPSADRAIDSAAERWNPLAQLDGDWAESSLGLDGPPIPVPAPDRGRPVPDADPSAPESTPPPTVPPRPETIESPGSVESEPTSAASGPPVFPGDLEGGAPANSVDASMPDRVDSR